MSKKSKLTFSIKKSLLVGTLGAASLGALGGCTDIGASVNPAPPDIGSSDAGDDAGDAEADASDAGDAEDDGDAADAGDAESDDAE
ncbi:MAG: hypothetical protein ACOCV2_06800 [Persicimonas sp.]